MADITKNVVELLAESLPVLAVLLIDRPGCGLCRTQRGKGLNYVFRSSYLHRHHCDVGSQVLTDMTTSGVASIFFTNWTWILVVPA